MKLKIVPLAATAVCLLAGCAGQEGRTGSDSSVVQQFDTVQALAAASPIIVRGQVVGQPTMEKADEDDVLGERVPVFNVKVARNVKGPANASAVIRVRTLAKSDDSDNPTLNPGSSYLLYLTDFMWHQGEPTGEYVIVGQQGAWQVTGDKAQRVSRIGSLPAESTETDLVAQSS